MMTKMTSTEVETIKQRVRCGVLGMMALGSLLIYCDSRPPVASADLPNPAPKTYIVQGGDTLSGIAFRLGCPGWKGLAQTNNIATPYLIRVKQVLNVPEDCSKTDTGGQVAAPKIVEKVPAGKTEIPANTPSAPTNTLPKEIVLANLGQEIAAPEIRLEPGESKEVTLKLGGKVDVIVRSDTPNINPGDFRMRWFDLATQAPHGYVPEDEPAKANSTSFPKGGPNAQIIAGGHPGTWLVKWENRSPQPISLKTTFVTRDSGCPSGNRASFPDLPVAKEWTFCVQDNGTLTY